MYLLIELFNMLKHNFSGHLKLVELKFEERLWVKKWVEQVITQSTVLKTSHFKINFNCLRIL